MNFNGFVKIRFPKCMNEMMERHDQRLRMHLSMTDAASTVPLPHNLTNLIKSVGYIEKLPEYSSHILRAQAVKRKLEAQREEKRRQNILSKRREEQREATEKFQRSHISSRPSSKTSNSSGKRSPKFSHRTLEDTLKLVRGSASGRHSAKHHNSPYSTQLFSTDPLNRPYINKYSSSYNNLADKQTDNSNPSHLHNNSLKNLSNSRNLFEQQLEQHQQLLVDQQQRTLNEFNDAIKNEIARDRGIQGVEVESDSQRLPCSESLSSVDSLENSDDSLQNSCDFANDNNEPQIERNQQYVNGQNDKNDFHSFHGNVTRNETVQHSPVNIVPPHRSCQSIQHQLDHDRLQNARNDQLDYQNVSKIDSYDINGTVNDVRKAKPIAERPKIQIRAWSTPSPVDSSHRQQQEPISQNSQRMMTNANSHTQRSTMTNVTTTTAYVRGNSNTGQPFVQSNGETGNPLLVNGSSNHPQPQVPFIEDYKTGQSSKNMEFLETVTNGFGSDRSEQNDNNMGSGTPKDPPPSRVPRPSTVVKKVIPSKQIAVPSPPSSTVSNNSNQILNVKTSTTTVSSKPIVLSVSRVDSKENEPKQQNGSIHENNTPKHHVVAGGKLAILPDKPIMPTRQISNQPKQSTKTVSVHKPAQKSKDDSELETVSKTKLEEMESGVVKSILKRPATSKIPTAGTIKRAGSTGSMNIKDSLEVAKSQMNYEKGKQKQPRKKSVRFADLNYPDEAEDETEEEDEDKLFTKRISVQITPKKRPFSAKAHYQTTETETTSKSYGRGSSASDRLSSQKHKSTIRPQAAAHIITHNSSAAHSAHNSPAGRNITHNSPPGNQEVDQTEKRISVINNNFMSKVPVSSVGKNGISQVQPVSSEVTIYTVPGARLNYAVSSTIVNPQKQELIQNGFYQQPTISKSSPGQGVTNGLYQEGPVYDDNGLRIDRTPTDDEINFLWDKVRNCLQRTPAPANSPVSDPVKPPMFDQNAIRQAAPVSHTYIDGAALGQIAAQARVSNVINQNPGSSRKSADPNGYQRRYGLLQRQKQQNPNSLNKNGSAQRQIVTYHGPMSSNLEPQQGNNQYLQRQDTGDSMTAFLMAEQLAQQSMTESQINHTINDVQSKPISANRPAANVPSALSIEERRLLESLDKLNEQLKITEYPGPLPQQAPPPQSVQTTVPQHYVHTGGFKGHQPKSQRRNSGTQRKMSPRSPTLQNFRFS